VEGSGDHGEGEGDDADENEARTRAVPAWEPRPSRTASGMRPTMTPMATMTKVGQDGHRDQVDREGER
jgi:hypothetical protein